MLFDNELDTDNEELGNIASSSSDEVEEATEAIEPNPAELEARKRGWVPKDAYRGKEDDWQDAESFLERNASLQTSVKELEGRIAQKDAEYAERIRRIELANERIIKNDREKLARELEQSKREAVLLGDVDEYDRIAKDERQYYSRIVEDERQLEQETKRSDKAPDLLPETQDWIRRNSWFTEKQHMQQIALGFYNEALEGMPANKDENKRLAYVEKRMATVYPEQFGVAKSSSVEGGRRSLATQKITDLKPEEISAMNRFIKRGIIKDKAEYIRLLNEE